jgi:hypothetical protein
MHYIYVVIGLALICVTSYILYSDIKNRNALKQNHKGKLYKMLFFCAVHIALIVMVIIESLKAK